MIDIFVVAILVALVQVSSIMAIEPGTAAQAFAGVVMLTMLAAHQFDVRLMWDKQQ
jgi:paraquat-inducible protein A